MKNPNQEFFKDGTPIEYDIWIGGDGSSDHVHRTEKRIPWYRYKLSPSIEYDASVMRHPYYELCRCNSIRIPSDF